MSRSYRKTPIIGGFERSEKEKIDRRCRQFRRRTKEALFKGEEPPVRIEEMGRIKRDKTYFGSGKSDDFVEGTVERWTRK